ncbi:ABC transporter ATP-binding protein [Desulfofustis glycolicus]|uniref:NitT/TauT family transport system ATP-binding protein n=1 Tax=Desulfofustis glycolicus DSM 9705 TaxID=1121409 RepID=A0A1M5Y6S5_9BACT|nr:ABC transporter ATP-binding protein [Desulfofustis glycolicus]SHI07672.1 NitT/TauT family transport system ATP-binding protein [Desulfofustis glycolicus DSM 9705]
MKQLHVIGVSKRYSSKRGSVKALASVSCSVQQGEFVALLGPSGCGKSTLLRLVAGLSQPDDGQIEFREWVQMPKARLVFQDSALFPWMSVWENVAFGLEMEAMPVAERRERAVALLATMGMADFHQHYPHELSGGMRQRVAIARAFATEPDILLMDEPLRALDAQMRLVVQEELLALWNRQKPMVLYVTHDIEEALLLADRVLVMSGKPGKIREEVISGFHRPRDLTGRDHKNLEELKWHIWKLLESDVRGQLQSGTANTV